jgi:hypothetical protein
MNGLRVSAGFETIAEPWHLYSDVSGHDDHKGACIGNIKWRPNLANLERPFCRLAMTLDTSRQAFLIDGLQTPFAATLTIYAATLAQTRPIAVRQICQTYEIAEKGQSMLAVVPLCPTRHTLRTLKDHLSSRLSHDHP